MIWQSLNHRPHGGIPMPLPPGYTTCEKNLCNFPFNLLIMKLLRNLKLDIPFFISNFIQMKQIKA